VSRGCTSRSCRHRHLEEVGAVQNRPVRGCTGVDTGMDQRDERRGARVES
jgi:hypothetical protein